MFQINKARKLVRILRQKVLLRALAMGVPAATEHEPFLRLIDCRTIVDIGANRGQFALMAHAIFPEARIIAFEPLAGPAATFRKIFGEDKRVTLHQLAIGSESGLADIHISERDDSSSLLPISKLKETFHPGTAEIGTRTIRLETLPNVLTPEDIASPALLKLDVQGFELETLKGCSELLDRFSHLYVECSFTELYCNQPLGDEVIAYLRDRGFALRGVYNVFYGYNGQTLEGDFFFVNTLHRPELLRAMSKSRVSRPTTLSEVCT